MVPLVPGGPNGTLLKSFCPSRTWNADNFGCTLLYVSAPFSSGESMRCLIFCLYFELLGLDFLFLTLLWPPTESDIVGKNYLPLSVFASSVGGWVGIIPGVLLRVTRSCTLGVARMMAHVVGVNEVFLLFCCFVS